MGRGVHFRFAARPPRRAACCLKHGKRRAMGRRRVRPPLWGGAPSISGRVASRQEAMRRWSSRPAAPRAIPRARPQRWSSR